MNENIPDELLFRYAKNDLSAEERERIDYCLNHDKGNNLFYILEGLKTGIVCDDFSKDETENGVAKKFYLQKKKGTNKVRRQVLITVALAFFMLWRYVSFNPNTSPPSLESQEYPMGNKNSSEPTELKVLMELDEPEIASEKKPKEEKKQTRPTMGTRCV